LDQWDSNDNLHYKEGYCPSYKFDFLATMISPIVGMPKHNILEIAMLSISVLDMSIGPLLSVRLLL